MTIHPEAFCHRCRRPNLPVWHAPSPLWNAVMRDPATGVDAFDGIVCPQCFAILARIRGVVSRSRVVWHLQAERGVVVALATETRDGRVWDPDQCLWVDRCLHGGKHSFTTKPRDGFHVDQLWCTRCKHWLADLRLDAGDAPEAPG